MHIIRFAETNSGDVKVGTLHDGQVTPLNGVHGFAELLALPLADARQLLDDGVTGASQPVEEVLLLPPVDGLMRCGLPESPTSARWMPASRRARFRTCTRASIARSDPSCS